MALGYALGALAAHMNLDDAASVADGMARALENPQETDSYRLSRLGYALGALAARMNLNDAASVATRGAAVLAKALENPQGTYSYRLASLGERARGPRRADSVGAANATCGIVEPVSRACFGAA